MKAITILGISGSLRAKSSNRAVLEVASGLTPAGVVLQVDEGIGTLPLFNPDLTDTVPHPVSEFRRRLASADAVLIASPEYAHGITGAMKNALDWVVGSGEFSGKPVAVINTSFRSFHAHESLMEIIRTMDARLIPEASIRVPLPGKQTTGDDISNDPAMVRLVNEILSHLTKSI